MHCSFSDDPLCAQAERLSSTFANSAFKPAFGVFSITEPTGLEENEALHFFTTNGEISNISFMPGQEFLTINAPGTYRLRYCLCGAAGQGSVLINVNDQRFLESERGVLNKCVEWSGVLTLHQGDKISLVNQSGRLKLSCATLELFQIGG